jgi:hypothetical protein
MQIGKPLSSRALFGPNYPKSFEGVYTLYDDDGSPVAAIGNLNALRPDCRYEQVRREIPGGWCVRTASCRTYRGGYGWLFFLVMFREGIDPHTFDDITIGEAVA